MAEPPARTISVSIEQAGSPPTMVRVSVPTSGSGKLSLLSYAKLYLRLVQARTVALPEVKQAEPQWRLLVDLWISTVEEKPQSVISLCIASGAPDTTGLRHIGLLRDNGYVLTGSDPHDGRRTLVELTDQGRAAVETMLAEELKALHVALSEA